ncbi:hypothetical protein AJ78_03787 [Emergomyces pasteurianus Ep9510]|uniref:Uncharacterized protein n=1 Tax=Emergomyces pasteurianus Ep9510 TaxID=1447872 RepID=A0A1J9Q6X7_9EURO|nr:hypothetical protein AJ78_03787 [Emergomyces pasteurianus Ep9510]
MALTQPISPPSRQPFGIIDPSRLRSLQSAKNQQNGITSPSLKRRLETSDLSDTENVDPSTFNSPSAKRTRNSLDEDISKTATATTKYTFATPKPITTTKSAKRPQTPLSQIKRAPLPSSAPLRAPAGRSPKSKPVKAFSRRSIGSYTRIDPPSFTKSHAAPRAPFSIADALRGTLSSINNGIPYTQSLTQAQALPTAKITPLDIDINIMSNSSSSSSSSKRHPKAWDFEIYTDTKQDEMANLMEHSTCVLDISDDEDKPRNIDDRGKENIPPPVQFGGQRPMDGEGERIAAATAAAAADGTSRNVEMTDEPRSALGELDVSRFVSVSEEVDDEEDNNESENDRATHVEDSQPQRQEAIKPVATPEPEARETITSPSQSQPPHSNADHCHYFLPYHHYHQQEPTLQSQAQLSYPTLSSHASISALICSTAPASDIPAIITATIHAASSPSLPTSNEIEIWESGSAADEAEATIRMTTS